MIMISVVVLMVISSLYFNVITFVIMRQTLTLVCRKTNNYFVALLFTSVSSYLLQGCDENIEQYDIVTYFSIGNSAFIHASQLPGTFLTSSKPACLSRLHAMLAW
jgi:hypothetical protein